MALKSRSVTELALVFLQQKVLLLSLSTVQAESISHMIEPLQNLFSQSSLLWYCLHLLSNRGSTFIFHKPPTSLSTEWQVISLFNSTSETSPLDHHRPVYKKVLCELRCIRQTSMQAEPLVYHIVFSVQSLRVTMY